jgi:CRP-like cAMP-binding protein
MQPRLSGWPVGPVDRGASRVREQLSRRQAALAAVPLFSRLSQKHVRQLARVSVVLEYPEGFRIVDEGEHGTIFYVVLSGRARVVRGRRTVAEVGPNGFFGEISLLDGGPRAASVVAKTTMRCLEISGNDFVGILAKDAGLALQVLKGMARWLREGGAPGIPVDAASTRRPATGPN